MTPLDMHILAPLTLGILVAAAGAALAADEKQKPQVVGKIISVELAVEESDPPSLVVTAVGQVPTGGYTGARLVRAAYVMAPADGIHEYFLLAVPPSGPATQVISQVKASDRWKDFSKDVKGVRVHGIGGGVIEKLLPPAK